MKLSFLDPLYGDAGPWASVYLDTSGDIDDPERATELRWRHLRDALTTQGADRATVTALAEAAIRDAGMPGRHGRALFATGGQLVKEERLPEPPVRDSARLGDIPDAMPLAVQHAPDVAYAVVVIGKPGLEEPERPGEAAGAAAYESLGRDEVQARLQTGRWPISRVAREPVVDRRFLFREWQHRAVDLARELEGLVRRSSAEVVVVCGSDIEVRGVFVNRLSRQLRERVVTPRTEEALDDSPGGMLAAAEVGEVLDGRLNERDRTHRDMLLAQRARHPAASEGVNAAVAALQRGQAQALLLNHPAEHPTPAWAGSSPTHIALSAEELRVYGSSSAYETPLDSALIRATVGTGAELVVLPQQEVTLADGAGVLLRHTSDVDR